uniref:Uncharacterized protein n=1 Tax=Bacillus thuringiensis serovar chinensis CT-43 TaxID=541229 RepID=E7CGG8_BACTU|nr:hypothetical protein pBMB0558_00205 [Bacillus thuringiensis serovar chinensis CT-43]
MIHETRWESTKEKRLSRVNLDNGQVNEMAMDED